MPDNVAITPGVGVNVAADEAPYSGDTAKVQIVQLAFVTGAEDARTLAKLPGDDTAGLKVDLGADNDVTVAGVATETTLASVLDALQNPLTAVVDGAAVVAYGEILSQQETTETGNTEQIHIAAPGAGFYLAVKRLTYQLLGTTVTTASLHAGTGGTERYQMQLRSQGDLLGAKVGPDEWQLPENVALYRKLSAADGTGVLFSVDYVVRPIS